jgi:nicotinamidase-related amidase/ribosomal protein S18 acetylase RimI-like enzyme
MNHYTIRPALPTDCPGIARVQVDSYRSAYRGFFPPAYLEQFSCENQAADWSRWLVKFPEDILLVAVDEDGQVLGYVLARAGRDLYPGYDSEVIAIHVLPPLKGSGIGRELMRRAVEALMRRGAASTMLWTLQGNPIRAWYERLDGDLLGEKRDWWDDWEMVEVAYGWRDLQALRGRLTMIDTALLVIDVQQGLFQKSIPIYQADALIANIQLLLRRARQAEAPVFFIQHSTDKVLVRDTPGWHFHHRVQPLGDDWVVEKHAGSCFDGTGLQAQLDELNIRRIVVCGLVTHGCVKAACQDGHALGYEVVLAQDAHSNFSKDAPRIIEKWNAALSQGFVTLLPAAEVRF